MRKGLAWLMAAVLLTMLLPTMNAGAEGYIVNDDFTLVSDGTNVAGWTFGGSSAVKNQEVVVPTTGESDAGTATRTFGPVAEDATVAFTLRLDDMTNATEDFIRILDADGNLAAKVEVTANSNARWFALQGGTGEPVQLNDLVYGGDTYYFRFAFDLAEKTTTYTVQNLSQPALVEATGSLAMGEAANLASFVVKAKSSFACAAVVDNLVVCGTDVVPEAPSMPVQTNVAQGKAVTVSTGEGDTFITDGNYYDGNRWTIADNTEKWAVIDLGTEMEINAARVFSGSDSVYGNGGYELQYNNESAEASANWLTIPGTVVALVADNGSSNRYLPFEDTITARYVRYYSNAPTRLREIALYGPAPEMDGDYAVNDAFDGIEDGGAAAGWSLDAGAAVKEEAIEITATGTDTMGATRTFSALTGNKVTAEFTLKMNRLPSTETTDIVRLTDESDNSVLRLAIKGAEGTPTDWRFAVATDAGATEAVADDTFQNAEQTLFSGDTYFLRLTADYTTKQASLFIRNLDQQGKEETITAPFYKDAVSASRLRVQARSGAQYPISMVVDNVKVYDGNTVAPAVPDYIVHPTNIAFGKPVTANPAANASVITDGNCYDANRWLAALADAGAAPRTAEIDLGGTYSVTGARIFSGGGSVDAASGYKLQYKNDADEWVDIAGTVVPEDTYTGGTFTANLYLPFDAPVTARYIRFLDTSTRSHVRLREIQLFGTELEPQEPIFTASRSVQVDAGQASATVTYVNQGSGDQSPVTLLGIYNADGTLARVYVKTTSVPDGETVIENMGPYAVEEGQTAKAFAWYGLDSLIPIPDAQ